MLFRFRRTARPLAQSSTEQWKTQWQSLVPPECRDVPVTSGGRTYPAFVCIGHFIMMLQDGLLMEERFFDVCDTFQDAGYHVVWLMRCTQDIANGYLRQARRRSGEGKRWIWNSPTTNFGRWTSDNFGVTILLQTKPLPEGALSDCDEHILERVTWAVSDDAARMVPGRTEFITTDCPGSPQEVQRWLTGTSLAKLREPGGGIG